MTVGVSEKQNIAERLQDVRERVRLAAVRSNRDPSDVQVIAISKAHPVSTIRTAIELGVSDLGENKVQEAEEKISSVGRDSARWHFVGHLQNNKARRAVTLFHVIHSVDSASLVERLERICAEVDRRELPVLIQIDLAGEETKNGIDPAQMSELLDSLKTCSRVRLMGLMTLPPFFEDPECARPFFKTLRILRDRLKVEGHFGDGRGELSMGMTHDFEIAIEEGATMVRIGTAIFGQRT